MEVWLGKQLACMTENWGGAIARFYPDDLRSWSDPEAQWKALRSEWNTLDAARSIDWAGILKSPSMKVLDLGSGTGWLSAYLSRFENTGEIYALDSDKKNLEAMLPGIIRLMDGVASKIRPVHGLFTPLICEDSAFDLIVSSSALHHAPNLFEVLREMKRALKDGGTLVILNETPFSELDYFSAFIKQSVKTAVKLIKKSGGEFETAISASGMLTDPYLGDRTYSYSMWDKAIRGAGFDYEVIVTQYFPYKNSTKNQKRRLVHFRCY